MQEHLTYPGSIPAKFCRNWGCASTDGQPQNILTPKNVLPPFGKTILSLQHTLPGLYAFCPRWWYSAPLLVLNKSRKVKWQRLSTFWVVIFCWLMPVFGASLCTNVFGQFFCTGWRKSCLHLVLPVLWLSLGACHCPSASTVCFKR